MSDPTQRFTDRVDDYVRHRPGYPAALVTTLESSFGLAPGNTRVVDVGAGTGISAALFLEAGYAVTAVEPNAAMRAAAEAQLARFPGFASVAGTAEAMPLPDGAADLLLAAQAFHWFHRADARREARRVLRAGGVAALVWNVRSTDATAFLQGYEAALLRDGVDYQRVRHENVDAAAIAEFFGATPREWRFANAQDFDLAGLLGRALSSSYVPKAGQPGHERFVAELEALFHAHAVDGHVRFVYETQLFAGPLGER